jgi:hypothetical protein
MRPAGCRLPNEQGLRSKGETAPSRSIYNACRRFSLAGPLKARGTRHNRRGNVVPDHDLCRQPMGAADGSGNVSRSCCRTTHTLSHRRGTRQVSARERAMPGAQPPAESEAMLRQYIEAMAAASRTYINDPRGGGTDPSAIALQQAILSRLGIAGDVLPGRFEPRSDTTAHLPTVRRNGGSAWSARRDRRIALSAVLSAFERKPA